LFSNRDIKWKPEGRGKTQIGKIDKKWAQQNSSNGNEMCLWKGKKKTREVGQKGY